MAWAGGGHPGMTGGGPGSGTGIAGLGGGSNAGPAGATGIGGTAAGLAGHPGLAGGAAGQNSGGYGGGFAGGGMGMGHPGMVGNGPGGYGGGFGGGGYGGGYGGRAVGDGGGYGGGYGDQGTKGDYGGPSIGSWGGPPSNGMSERGMIAAIAESVGLSDRGFSERGWSPGKQFSDRIGPSRAAGTAVQGTKGNRGKLGTRMGMPATAGMRTERGRMSSTHSKGFSGKTADGFTGMDIGAQRARADRAATQATARSSGYGFAPNQDPGPRGIAPGTASSRTKGDIGGPTISRGGYATAQDPGPRGMPAPPGQRPALGFPSSVGPRHSSPTPAPASQDKPFNVRDDFGPIADRVFGELGRASDMMSGMNARAGFQQGRVGGVGGGGTGGNDIMAALLARGANFNNPSIRGR